MYLGNYLEEMMPLLRMFWNDRCSEIISSVFETRRVDGLDRRLVDRVMDFVFDRFEVETSGAATKSQVATIMPL